MGHLDPQKRLQGARTHDLGLIQQPPIHPRQAIVKGGRDWEIDDQYRHHNFGGHPIAEPKRQHRRKGKDRHGLGEHKDRQHQPFRRFG